MDILLIEDDVADARAAQRAMSTHPSVGRVYVECSGDGALRWLRQPEHITPPVQVIVLDLGLPGMSGLEVLANLKQDFLLSAVPVVVLSGGAEPEELMQVYRLGACAFMKKPDQADDYQNILDGVLRFWLLATLPD